ncbi:helix-turn-helix domain-containing protein [Xanthomonas populi]|uniref:helix-turn-helix domain-containing protein n=1 Tax=Xanthomonas populi TaxID=53414 RepID=UPI001304CA30|nr:helix-turn-helix domain-containing protein [Xanthomonas populi]
MDKEDARHQTLDRLHERRKQGVRLHRLGHGLMQIVKLTGLSSPTVRRVIDGDASGGPEAPLNADLKHAIGSKRRNSDLTRRSSEA